MGGLPDPGDDGDAELLASGPGLPVEVALLQEAKRALQGCVAPGGADPAHRSDHGMPGECAHVLPASKLRFPAGMKHAAGNITIRVDCVVQRVDCCS